jgi:L-2-hydroxyglutarate oxidase
MHYDCCIVGAGIVGLATAFSLLQRQPDLRLLILEKETSLAAHQTGHNSGVVHSGIYYRTDSLKARLCRAGCVEMKRFCAEHDLPLEPVGKLIVATTPLELDRMLALGQRAADNGIATERLNEKELSEAEPNIVGLGALRVPSTAITDYRAVCQTLLSMLIGRGVEVRFGAEVAGMLERSDMVVIDLARHLSISVGTVVACAGLQSDRLAKMAGLEIDSQIVPFKGEYYELPQSRSQLISHLIYPVPDPTLPFLGVHLTRHVDGSITVGPNAVLSLHREGYGRHSFDRNDARETLAYPGFWRLAGANMASGVHEMSMSLSKRAYLKAVRKYCPDLTLKDLATYSSGIRAQAVTRDGKMVEDFSFVRSARTLHVLNAPSPAATSSFPIGRLIAETMGTI